MHRQIFSYHPVIGYLFVPNLKARIATTDGGYLIRTNAQGFRSNTDLAAIRSVKKRVLLFGDSFTAGDGVSNGERYSDVLERSIPELEVYNFGIPGTGTDQHYLIYREIAASLERDAIIVSVLVENIRRVSAHYRHYADPNGKLWCYAKPYFDVVGESIQLKNVPVPKKMVADSDVPADERVFVDRGGRYPMLRRWAVRSGMRDLLQKATHYQPLPEYKNPAGQSWRLMKSILKMWLSPLKNKVLLVPVPLYQHIEGTADASAYQKRFHELAEDIGCRLLDPLPQLLDYSARERRCFRLPHDIHLSRLGHQALARCLEPAVKSIIERQNG